MEYGTPDLLVLWSCNGQSVRHVTVDLGQDFTDEWHTFELQVYMKEEKADIDLVSSCHFIYELHNSVLVSALRQSLGIGIETVWHQCAYKHMAIND